MLRTCAIVTFQALHKTKYLILCKLPATLVVFSSKGSFPGQSEGAGSINIIRNIAIKLGDFDGVARAHSLSHTWRAHSLSHTTAPR